MDPMANAFLYRLDGCMRTWSIANAKPEVIFPVATTAGAGGVADGYGVVAGDESGAAYIMQLEGRAQGRIRGTTVKVVHSEKVVHREKSQR